MQSNQISLRSKALADLGLGIRLWRIWTMLGWNDILQRYRRSMLGPFWLTASMGIMVLALGTVYSRIFKIDINEFLPFLSIGLIFWGFISSALTESGTLFVGNESYIKQIRLPYWIYVFRFVWSKLIILAHNFVIYFAIILYFQIWPGAAALYVIPAMVLIVLNALFASLWLGMVSARFRDIPQIVASVVQIIFFVTPIMWKPHFVGVDSSLLLYNPFYYLIEIVRQPLLGEVPSLFMFAVVGAMTVVNGLIAAAFFVRFRSRIAYWS
jgi:lipopolysaccharide transport system permease protein